MEAVVVGDLHFDGPISRLIPDSHKMICREMQKVVDWATKHGVSTFIQAGDVCDGPRMTYESTLELIAFLRKNKHMQFYFILGNHDKFAVESNVGHSLELLHSFELNRSIKNARFIVEPEDIEIDNAKVRFLPWPHSNFHKSYLNIAHIEVKGSKSDSGRTFNKDGLPDGKEVAIIGHLHTPHKVRNHYYVGTLYQSNFGETLPKYFNHVSFNSRQDYEVTQVPHKPEYSLHNVVIDTASDLKNIPKDPKALVKLIVSDGCKVDPSKWASLPNVVKVNAYRNAEELSIALTEDLVDGSELTIQTDDFFEEWLRAQDVPTRLLKQAMKTRNRILGRLEGAT